MSRRLEDLKMRNTDRWKAHLQERAESEGVGASTNVGSGVDSSSAPVSAPLQVATNPEAAPVAAPVTVPTAMQPAPLAKLHNRAYQRVDPPSRTMHWHLTQSIGAAPVDYANAKSAPPLFSPHEPRVPVTSATRKQGDCKLFLCCGWRWTAAQWIWGLNFLCLLAHTAMIFVTLHFAYWRHGLNPSQDTKHVEIPIYRIRNIPTQYMIDNNQTRWSEGQGWNLTSSDPNSGLFLYDNGRPINLASLIIAFFATSAIFHLFACVAGAFQRWWFWYWRQLDDCFAWWRWLEYAISASLMSIAMGIVLGIREQNTLASLFMLTFATQTYGFLTELYSRPKACMDDENDEAEYYHNPNALALISQTEWASGRVLHDPKDPTQPVGFERVDYWKRYPRTRSYVRRMLPHIFGWFTMISVWAILIAQLEYAKHDIDKISDQNIPAWVNALIYGSFLIFTQFAFVQIVFQGVDPGLYWATEIAYCILSLAAKLFLGLFILINVIMADASANDTLSGAGAGAEMRR
tara:strand:- start:1895 stop:3448 length:1554 start_codon:yes stop_codon:yes gene_type:complete